MAAVYVCSLVIAVLITSPAHAAKVGKLPVGIFHHNGSSVHQYIRPLLKEMNETRGSTLAFVDHTSYIYPSNTLEYKKAICRALYEGMFVGLGVENTTTERSIMSITERLHVPFITLNNQDLLTEKLNYRIHLVPSYVKALASLQTFYGWRHIFYLYSDEAGLSRYEELYGHLSTGDIELDLRYIDQSAENFYSTLRNFDQKYSTSGNVIGKTVSEKALIIDLSTDQLTQRMLQQLVDVGMVKDDYHLVLATLSIKNLNLKHFLHGGATVTGFQLAGLKQPDLVKALAKDAVILTVMSMYNQLAINQTTSRNGYGNLAKDMENTDGVRCIADKKPWQFGSTIMRLLKQTTFNGDSGLVKFDRNGFRKDYKIDIHQQQINQPLKKVGFWTEKEGLVKDSGIRDRKTDSGLSDSIFANETFIVTTVLLPPYAMRKNSSDGTPLIGNDQYEGYAIDLAEKLSKMVRFKYKIVPAPDNNHGVADSNGTWNGMVGELIAGRADMAIADLTIQSARERVVDFSTPFMNLGISIMIKKPEKQKPSVLSFMEPLSNEVWTYMMLCFISVSLVIWATSRLSPVEWKVDTGPDGADSIENEFTLMNSGWFVTGAIMCQGSEISPVAPSGRVIGSAWWFFSLIVISSYTANLAAFLTVENIVIPVNSAQDLQNHDKIKFGTLAAGTTRAFFENGTSELFQNMWEKMLSFDTPVLMNAVDAGIEKVRNSKGDYAFLLESTTNEYANQRKPCNTMKVGENLDSKSYGVATPFNHKLRHPITMAILKLQETGELNKLKQVWWYDKGQCSGESSSPIKALSLSNVAGVFYILIGGLVIALLAAVAEFLYKSIRDAKKYKQTLRESMRSKAKLSIAGASLDTPFSMLPRPSFQFFMHPPPQERDEKPT